MDCGTDEGEVTSTERIGRNTATVHAIQSCNIGPGWRIEVAPPPRGHESRRGE